MGDVKLDPVLCRRLAGHFHCRDLHAVADQLTAAADLAANALSAEERADRKSVV